ncbi:hypothetical protein CALVIDRAFT_546671 [Calocera viscosa TUFC12733]|uniref:Uncharacterized protein n=1 Tax=Calocera viscosa (strain TUFC12733) TaxID=1330018 RepID=A0A167J7C0_CALVF|nr:hypothetical protein CALVIDRAFT_546671 [Calocera viscosa TUFC12733]
MPDHLDGIAQTGTVTITQVSEKTAYDPGIGDLGWNEKAEDVPQPVIGGVTNDALWMLVRRFDKQMYHVKAVPDEKVVGALDLQVAEEEEFSPDKLRANLERLYVSVLIGLMAGVKHVMRLRSWNEPRRTGVWLALYLVAWWTDMILPALFGLLLVLIIFPPTRDALFPPAPLALVSSTTGNVQTPRAGTLATGDTLTGAPENHAGEAAEQEATNFVNGFASLAVGTALGKHPDGDADEGSEPSAQPIDKSLPDPSNLGTTALDAKQTAGGEGMERAKDRTKQPMEVAIWTKARPAMRALTAVADTWEMLGNALSPTPPFNHLARAKLAGVVAPLVLVTALTSSQVLIKALGAGAGFGFFGQPVIDRGLAFLNRKVPGWQRALDLRNSLLLGVPTNAQLTLTLLRIGEANKAPLPPPPITKEAPPSQPSSPIVKHEELPSDLQNSEVEHNVPPEQAPDVAHGTGKKTEKKHKVMSKLGGLFKGTTKAGVSGVLTADRVKANLGSEHAKQRLGIIPPSADEDLVDGPSVFEARVHGKIGHVIISTTATTPCVSWIPAGNKRSLATGEWEAQFSILLSDIQEMRKIGGLGWKGKLVVGWAYEREVYDGLEIIDSKGKTWTFTAMKRRDELFNRLVALVKHKWEAW